MCHVLVLVDGETEPVRGGCRNGDAEYWTASTPDFGRMDDGLSAELAWRRYAAFGDAVDPRLSYMIGRAILAAEAQALTEAE